MNYIKRKDRKETKVEKVSDYKFIKELLGQELIEEYAVAYKRLKRKYPKYLVPYIAYDTVYNLYNPMFIAINVLEDLKVF